MKKIRYKVKYTVCRLASAVLLNSIMKSIAYEEGSTFQERYETTIQDYDNSDLAVFSTIKIGELESAQEWFEELRECKANSIPLLISKMLNGDIFSVNIYNAVYKHQPELVLDYTRIFDDPSLKERFLEYGMAEGDRARLTAEHWFSSQEAVDLLGRNEDLHFSLCVAIQLLGITNEFVDCS